MVDEIALVSQCFLGNLWSVELRNERRNIGKMHFHDAIQRRWLDARSLGNLRGETRIGMKLVIGIGRDQPPSYRRVPV